MATKIKMSDFLPAIQHTATIPVVVDGKIQSAIVKLGKTCVLASPVNDRTVAYVVGFVCGHSILAQFDQIESLVRHIFPAISADDIEKTVTKVGTAISKYATKQSDRMGPAFFRECSDLRDLIPEIKASLTLKYTGESIKEYLAYAFSRDAMIFGNSQYEFNPKLLLVELPKAEAKAEAKAFPNFNKLNKAQLIAWAKNNGVDIDPADTVADIRADIAQSINNI